ncbi:MAG: Cyclic pyranopterin monophosphate synthase accessory protein [Thermotoga sp. 50_1627]|uniref:cyclic pyranopterin monophosphate synthase MoaC n=1 Tax=Pseudothermotoga sp. TaxID=2033661 RepID=UPI00076D3719|nr:MAG: Cyclic pyranopterin monophosphate synthase accessory protein [Thermotoga sp. 50_64]KUK24740.1 MAG: Cyclic pyranopterin monophosphate synthase accessory protein [Thermotoga sp. 50_1627]MBC7116497.1 cyclic pyranopterin monophosphate synthase MoaC [Pseudothermotoga sp.]MDK2923106.1 cyclic pyranopterin monophosphate synthase [Pseudothermotoga sp.]
MPEFSHLDDQGNARMVDVSQKQDTERIAIAQAKVRMKPETLKMILEGSIKKGDVLTTAKIAAIMAAKRTSELIPLCHNINLSHVDVEFEPDVEKGILAIRSSVKCVGKTGVEMEALVSASIAALTVYDMCKSAERGIVVEEICLLYKAGGKSGEWKK